MGFCVCTYDDDCMSKVCSVSMRMSNVCYYASRSRMRIVCCMLVMGAHRKGCACNARHSYYADNGIVTYTYIYYTILLNIQ